MLENAVPRGMGERLLALRTFRLLSSLPAAELALVARLSRENEYQHGQPLAVEGQPVEVVQLLVSGTAVLSRAGVSTGVMAAHEAVGLLPIAAASAHRVTAVAAEAVHALEIDADVVADVLDDNFDLFIGVLRMGAAAALARGSGPAPAAAVTSFVPYRAEGGVRIAGGKDDAATTLLGLRQTALFRHAPVDGLASFAKRLTPLHLPAGAEIEAGGAAGRLAVLVSGSVDVLHAASGSPVPVATGVVLGALEALAGLPVPVRVRARTPVSLLCGTAADLLDVLEDHHAMGRRLLGQLLDGV